MFRHLAALGCLTVILASAAAQEPLVDKVLKERIDQAVERGLSFLRKTPPPRNELHVTGGQALIGWTLLECGVPATDEMVRSLAERIRNGAIDQDSNHGVYNLSLALIFLDKLGDRADEPLIESLTVRLLVAQNAQGGWSYPCPPLGSVERDRLKAAIKDRRERLARGEELGDKKRTPEQALKDMRNYVGRLAPDNSGITLHYGGDNSNTQFAMMALWVARRHELPVDYALGQLGKRFRGSQDEAGAWYYLNQISTMAPAPNVNVPRPTVRPIAMTNNQKYPAMTCAGLLALAMEKGAQSKTKDLLKDPLVARGMDYLSKQLASGKALPLGNAPALGPGNPVAPVPLLTPPNRPDEPAGGGLLPFAPRDRGGNYYYYLFSLERMAVVYDLKTIGKTDWYLWGAEDLVNSQSAEGDWQGAYKDWHADTCFALLFLKRANVARDLTDLVKGIDRRPAVKTAPKNDPLLDLPLILPKDEKKAAPPKQASPKQSSLGNSERSPPRTSAAAAAPARPIRHTADLLARLV